MAALFECSCGSRVISRDGLPTVCVVCASLMVKVEVRLD